MSSPAFRRRFLPAILTAAGATLIAAGLLNYSGAVQANPLPSTEPPVVVTASPGMSVPLPTLPPMSTAPSASASPVPSAPSDRVATRVVVPALDIDLPVIKPRGGASAYPQCDVAMYIQELFQPGSGKSTYLYAHARDGMFGPIYERAILKRDGGPRSMLGMAVEVYTSDDQLYQYQITKVLLHQTSLDDAIRATSEQLWLQTSEGPKGTPGKTQVLAVPVGVEAADHKAAHPVARPVNCG